MRRAAAAMVIGVLLVGTPADAWQYVERNNGDNTLVGAWEDIAEGYELAVECDRTFSEPDLYLFTPEVFDTLDLLDFDVPITVTVDGVTGGPVFGATENMRGHMAIGVHARDESRLGPLFHRLQRARSSIEVQYGDKTLHFGVDKVGWVVASLLSRCRALPAD